MSRHPMDADTAETLAGVVRLLRRVAEFVWAAVDTDGAGSPRQMLGLGIDLAADEARNLLPDPRPVDGPMPVGDEPTSLLRSAEQCLVPRRHVLGLQELEGVEAALIGRLLWAASRALIAVTGCEKTYVLLLAEQESFTHVHFHIVPRHRDLDPSMRGARIFGYLGNRKDAPGPADDKLAAKLGAEVEAALAD